LKPTGRDRHFACRLVLALALSILGAELVACLHHHALPRARVVDTGGSSVDLAGACPACRVFEQKLSMPAAVEVSHLTNPIPWGIPAFPERRLRSRALRADAPRAPPAPVHGVV